jgi:hypothetical protein
MTMVRIVAFALITANIVNAVGNWVLIYGKWGAPAMGAVGSGWSTALARLYMAAVLIVYLLWYDARHRTDLLKTPVDIDLPRPPPDYSAIPPRCSSLSSSIFALVTALIARPAPCSSQPSDAQHRRLPTWCRWEYVRRRRPRWLPSAADPRATGRQHRNFLGATL